MMRTVAHAGDLNGKRVLMRTDFDVPVKSGAITDAFRIVRQKGQIKELMDAGTRVVLMAHISAAPSFAPLVNRLQEILDLPLQFLESPDALENFWNGTERLGLLENLRTWPEEEAGDTAFAERLAHGTDLFVNNAFAVCHRPHASIIAVPRILPAYAGSLVLEEVRQLAHVISAPAAGKIIFIGGAKSSTKVPVIRHLIDKTERIAVGGVVANDILKLRGVDIDDSQADPDADVLLKGVDVRNERLLVPEDQVRDSGRILDIGPDTAARFAAAARSAALAVWNGPMGKFEDERFSAGTRTLAEAMASTQGFAVIGGGDTIAAVAACGIPLERFGHVCTGGGAMLAFLAGERLPGLDALGYASETNY